MQRTHGWLVAAILAVAALGYGCTTDPVKQAGSGGHDGFAGSTTCGACHQDHYKGWTDTYHSKMVRTTRDGLLKDALDNWAKDTVFEWDVGVSKVIRAGPLNVTLMADVFNILNRNTVLQRQTRIRSKYNADGTINRNPNDNAITEIQSPRIWRFGVRLSF